MFEQQDNPNCPVKIFKLYISKHPTDFQTDLTSKFYLRPLDNPKDDIWYSHQCLGKNKLGTIMKTMADAAEIYGRKVNHSTIKTFATSLLHSERPVTEVAQLGGCNGISTLTHYNYPSIKQQDKASSILSEVVIPKPCDKMTFDSANITLDAEHEVIQSRILLQITKKCWNQEMTPILHITLDSNQLSIPPKVHQI